MVDPLQQQACDRSRALWIDALARDPAQPLRANFIQEAADFFRLSPDAARHRLEQGDVLFAQEWREQRIDPRDEQAVMGFYSTETEIFELLKYHSDEARQGMLNYVAALQVALTRPGRRYLDFGSGIGAGGLLFARHGFAVTLADISAPLLAFSRWRFEQRQLTAQHVNVRRAFLPSEAFDVVTCFDVLEHVVDPQPLLRTLSRVLAATGLLFLFAPMGEDDRHPMHIMHDRAFLRHIRGLGFRHRWELRSPFLAMGNHACVFERVERGPWLNSAFQLYDRTPGWLRAPVESAYRMTKRCLATR